MIFFIKFHAPNDERNSAIFHSVVVKRQQRFHLQSRHEPPGHRNRVWVHGKSSTDLGPKNLPETHETQGTSRHCQSSGGQPGRHTGSFGDFESKKRKKKSNFFQNVVPNFPEMDK